MNGPIVRVFGVTLVLFALLIGFTSRWAVFERGSLQDNPQNKRALIAQQRIDRGRIFAADGQTLARSTRRADGAYTRRYPLRGLFAHPVGYSYLNPGTAGLERFYNGELNGRSEGLENALRRLQGKRRQGNDLRTALDPVAQQVALDQLAGRPGAVVALDPRTGRVKVMASVPGYDPNVLRSASATTRLNTAPGSPLFNRVTQSGYPPGSTFKVVTAIAAIDSGKYEPTSVVDGTNGIKISGVPLNNDGGESFGKVDLTTALTNSINTVWAQVGEDVGPRTMQRYMDRLGFDAGRRRPARVRAPAERGVLQRTLRARDEPVRRRRPDGDRPGQAAGDAAADGDGRLVGRQSGRPDAPVPGDARDQSGGPHDAAERPEADLARHVPRHG